MTLHSKHLAKMVELARQHASFVRLVKRIKERGLASMENKRRPGCCCYPDACDDILAALAKQKGKRG